MAKGRSTWGSIRKRGKESWEIRYPVGSRSRSETIRGTRSDAERRLAELRIEYEGVPADITVDQFWNTRYHDDIVRNLAPKTVEGYENKYAAHIRPAFGNMAMRDIRPHMVQDFLLEKTRESAIHCRVVISSMWARSTTWGITTENVGAYKYQMPKEKGPERNKDVYTPEQLDEIAEACKGEFWEGAFLVAAFGGALLSEADGVMLDEIRDVDGFAVITPKRKVQRIHSEVQIIDELKTEFRKDDMIIAPPYSLRLFELRDEGLKRGDIWLADNGYGAPSDPTVITRAFKRWFQRKPYVYIPFGNLRKAYSTALHNLEIEDSTVSKLMRHSNLETDYRHYNSITTEDKIAILKQAAQ